MTDIYFRRLWASSLAAITVTAACIPCHGTTIYHVARQAASPPSLSISVDRPPSDAATQLVLRGAAFHEGIVPQVASPACDGIPLVNSNEQGIWNVPAGCQHLSWTVPMDAPGIHDVGWQRSVASPDGRFLLLSESSSVPRLADAVGPELLQLTTDLIPGTIPSPNGAGLIRLPDPSLAPLFVLLDPTPVASRSDSRVTLTFYIDDPAQERHLPNIDRDMRALSWLVSLAPNIHDTDFRVAWLGVLDASKTMGGATGTNLLLANYRVSTGNELNDVRASHMALAIPLFEAIHKIRGQFGKPAPRWVGESLITFYGLMAIAHEYPQDKYVRREAQEFVKQAKDFPLGLLAIQRRVEAGDPSQYGAFFSKGFAYWTALDHAVRLRRGFGLERYLPQIMGADYDTNGQPNERLARELGLPSEQWKHICDVYLGR